MGGSFIFGDVKDRKFRSLCNLEICIASLAHLLPALRLGTKWRLS